MNIKNLIAEMIQEEVMFSKPLRQLNEISSEVYDGVVNAAANLSDSQMNPLFGDQERVLIPMKAEGNEQVQAFYDNIVTPLATKGIKVNLEDGTATKEVTTQRGKQERKTRLGKAIGKELSDTAKTWWNKFQAEFLGNPDILKAKYGIVITQHPVDVARMSDFSEADIQSCHSEGSDYFTCALADAKRAGAVAYLINGEDVDYAEQNLDDNELFADENRGVEGITPISRVRLRRFDNPDLAKQGSALALLAPETRIYGERIPGFLNTVADWAREVQKGHPVFKKKLDLRGFTLRGGSYQDTASSEMFNILVGPENLELNPELEAYGYSDQTRKESGENDIDYVDDGRSREMIDYAVDQIESFRYDLLDHESVNFDYNVEWDDWGESVEISYEIDIEFDYKFANFVGSPNLGKGTEEELLKALDREAPLSAIRLVAETAYEDSEHHNYNIETSYSVKIVDQRFGVDTRKIVQFKMFLNSGAVSADELESDIAREIKIITDSYDEIDAEIEEALKEDGWIIETPFDKLKTDPENSGKLGEDSFDFFSITKGPNGIGARTISKLEGYPKAGIRLDSGVKTLYREGPKFVEIMRADDRGWSVDGGLALLPPNRRTNVLNALKKEIMDASRAAAAQPQLPMAGLPAKDDSKDMRPILPEIENVQIFMKQGRDDKWKPSGELHNNPYNVHGGILFTFKPGSSEEQIQANLRFIKYFDQNIEPVQDALQREWNDIHDKFEKELPLTDSETKTESISSFLRQLIKEELLNERVTDEVWHILNPTKWDEFQHNNRFLVNGAFTKIDSEAKYGKNKLYYLSTARTPSSSYFSTYNVDGIILKLDGRKLNHNFKGYAMDYWANEYEQSEDVGTDDYGRPITQPKTFTPKDPGGNDVLDKDGNPVKQKVKQYQTSKASSNPGQDDKAEAEDRVVLDKPYIEDAMSYVLEAHLGVPITRRQIISYKKGTYEVVPEPKVQYERLARIKDLYEKMTARNIPVYLHLTPDTWKQVAISKSKAATKWSQVEEKIAELGVEVTEPYEDNSGNWGNQDPIGSAEVQMFTLSSEAILAGKESVDTDQIKGKIGFYKESDLQYMARNYFRNTIKNPDGMVDDIKNSLHNMSDGEDARPILDNLAALMRATNKKTIEAFIQHLSDTYKAQHDTIPY